MTYSVRVHENLIALTWFGQPGVEGLREVEKAFAKVASSGRKIGFATLIMPEATPDKAPAEVRNGFAELLKRYSDSIGATVVIYEAPGLRATMLRTIIMTINLLGRSKFPTEVHSDLARGKHWMVKQLGAHAPSNAEAELDLMLGPQASAVSAGRAHTRPAAS